MNDAAIESLNERLSATDKKLEHLKAHLYAQSWQTHEAEGDNLVRDEQQLKNEISEARSELLTIRSSLRIVEMRTVTVPTA